jgi:hypothetical protein
MPLPGAASGVGLFCVSPASHAYPDPDGNAIAFSDAVADANGLSDAEANLHP